MIIIGNEGPGDHVIPPNLHKSGVDWPLSAVDRSLQPNTLEIERPFQDSKE